MNTFRTFFTVRLLLLVRTSCHTRGDTFPNYGLELKSLSVLGETVARASSGTEGCCTSASIINYRWKYGIGMMHLPALSFIMCIEFSCTSVMKTG